MLVRVYTQDVGDQWYFEGQEGLVDVNDGVSQLSDAVCNTAWECYVIGEQ